MYTRTVQLADPRQASAFFGLPRQLNGDDPRWVEPLHASLLADLTGQSAFSRYARLQPLLAWEGERALGRVVAVLNPRLTGADGAPLGQLGWFEAVDDQAVADSLFAAAGEWLAAAGASQLVGPLTGAAHRANRLQLSGFASEPFLFEPRNPPYHEALWRGAGFSPWHHWTSHELDAAGVAALLAVFDRLAADAVRSGRYRVEQLDPRQPDAVFSRLHPLVDGCWRGHTGFASFDRDELAESFGPLLPLMSAGSLSVLVEIASGRELGFAYSFPDWVDELRALQGDARGWGRWLADLPAARPPRRAVYHTVAVLPEVRGSGAAYLLSAAGVRAAQAQGYDQAIAALVDEDFRLFGKIPAQRRYALFTRPLAGPRRAAVGS